MVTSVMAQALRVSVGQDTIYAGDSFTLTISTAQTEVVSVTPHFSMPTQIIGQSKQMTSINGKVTSSLILHVMPQEVGTCRLNALTAVTNEGKELSYTQPLDVTVRELLPDPEVAIILTMTPEAPLPGDDVVLQIKVTAPALNDNSALRSPFLEAGFFGGVQERIPRVSFNAETGEDSPLRQTSAPTLRSKRVDGTNMEWIVETAYQAVRVGEQTFPAPVLNDMRYTWDSVTNQLKELRCLTIGKPLTAIVKAPPEEGRPERFTGAVAKHFKAEIALDAVNVKVGDPVKLTVTFTTDAMPEQIRLPQLPSIPGFRVYGDPTRDTFEGGCAFVYSLRPIQQGLLEIPPLTFAWFEKETRQYHVEQTFAVPLYAHPSSQLVLLGDDGEAFASILPPALRLDEGQTVRRTPSLWAWLALGFGAFAFLCRLLGRPVVHGLHWILSPIRHHQPTLRACAALRRVNNPADALAIIRTWSGRPTLTAADLRGLLPDTPEAETLIMTVARLEQVVYTQGGDASELYQTLIKILPKVARPKAAVRGKTVGFLLIMAFCPTLWSSAASLSFIREQAIAVSLSASTPADYAHAASLWLAVDAQGEMPQTARLNAASCAIFARKPHVAQQLVAQYELDYGRDQNSERIVQAIAEQLNEPIFWGRLLFAPHYNAAYATRLDIFCYLTGCFLLLVRFHGND